MPLRRFRSLEAMEDALWYPAGDPALWDAIRRVWDFADRSAPRAFPPGVYRHRSIEEAQALRSRWEHDNFRAFWDRQRKAGVVLPAAASAARPRLPPGVYRYRSIEEMDAHQHPRASEGFEAHDSGLDKATDED
jgi:hypothetical protein